MTASVTTSSQRVIWTRYEDLQARHRSGTGDRALVAGSGDRRNNAGGRGVRDPSGRPTWTGDRYSGVQSTATVVPFPQSTPACLQATLSSTSSIRRAATANAICYRCLKPGHFAASCVSRICSTCGRRDHGAKYFPSVPTLLAAFGD